CHYLVTYTHEHHGHSSCYINFFPSSEPTKSLSYQSGSSFFIFVYVHKPFCLPTHHLSPTEGFHPEDLLVPNNILLILQALIKKYCFLFFFSGRSTRAYKVAGLTLLACVLIVGQAMTAYFLLSQKNDIKSLEDQNNKLESQVSRVNSAPAPMKMHLPSNSLVMSDFVDTDSSTGTPDDSSPPPTKCQLEASGVKPVQVPGFKPACEKDGLYKAQQCFESICWCVNTATGEQIDGSMRQGRANCNQSVRAGTMIRMLSLPSEDN
ncbi:H-2 class II histocompatibility antigen gamma chain-like, partial [Pundamilia nyererei]|uniref:H-2 class II histocompatibility antigen gamma chain-like n=1 Tax=Pundamilia nyererei TaxID=303518 RepID=A0A9Y6JC04_9CICH